MTEIEYASSAVKPLRKRRFVGYDLRFQYVKSMNPMAPKRETHIIHGFDWIQVLYPALKYDTELTAMVAMIWRVLSKSDEVLTGVSKDALMRGSSRRALPVCAFVLLDMFTRWCWEWWLR